MDNNKKNLDLSNRTSAMQKAPPTRRTAWPIVQLFLRVLWGTFGWAVWTFFPFFRSVLLRLFGAKVGKNCTFARTVQITIPWNLIIGNDCHFSEHSILYSLGIITLGDRVRVDTRAHLCAGSHDMKDTTFPLTRPPITIGDDTFIGVDAYIAPTVTLAPKTIVHPRASVYGSFDHAVELLGNPARVLE
ncbi:MAG: colanic acid biosynthesis acetyltransferase WcaF [Phycisphaerae bacterium]|nr:colanic acid biosynthesis acetyltransferase WcaF [Phycisphaerae bacterium]